MIRSRIRCVVSAGCAVAINIITAVFIPGTLYVKTASASTTPPAPIGGGPALKNPLGSSIDSIPELIEAIINNIVLPIGSVVVVFMIIFSGFLFVKARGNEQELTKAKTAFTWTVVGAVVLLGSWAISSAIFGTICEITGGLPGLGC